MLTLIKYNPFAFLDWIKSTSTIMERAILISLISSEASTDLTCGFKIANGGGLCCFGLLVVSCWQMRTRFICEWMKMEGSALFLRVYWPSTLFEFSRKPIATMYWINPAATVSQWSGKGSSKILFSKSPDTLSTITGNASINRVAGALRDSSAQLGLQIAEMLQHLL